MGFPGGSAGKEFTCNFGGLGFNPWVGKIRWRRERLHVKKKELELDMEHQTGSKLGKEYVKAVYCHPAYLTYMQSTS